MLGPVIPACASCTEKIALRQASAAAKAFQFDSVIGAALAGRGVAADGDPDRVDHLFRRQPHQAAGADHGRDAGDRRMVDAVAEIVEDIRDLAEHLVGEHGRGDEIAAAAPGQLGRGQQRRDRIARVAGAMGETDEGVVEIQIADHHAVGEDREIGARLDAAEQDCRALLCADVARELDRDLAWSRRVAAERAADRIENGALCDPYDVFREILVPQIGRIAGKRLGHEPDGSPPPKDLARSAPAGNVGVPATNPAAAACLRK